MSDATFPTGGRAVADAKAPPRRDIGLKKRYAAERRFKAYGISAIAIGMIFLATLLYTVISQGYTAFWQTQIRLPITFSQSVIDPKNTGGKDMQALRLANYPKLVQDALVQRLGIDPTNRADVAAATQLVSQGVRTSSAAS